MPHSLFDFGAEREHLSRISNRIGCPNYRVNSNPHVWATVLFDEVADLGYDRAYQTFTRKVRERDLRPHCAPCASSTGRATVDIEHPPGEEIQWDWLELADTPWGRNAYVLVGALSHSSRRRGWFCDSDDQAMAMQDRNRAETLDQLRCVAALGPVGIGRLVRIDTAEPLDPESMNRLVDLEPPDRRDDR